MASAATLFQRNKHIYVDEEDKLQRITGDDTFLQTFQNWLDTTISQLDYQYERCEQQLAELQQSVAVEGGNFWCGKTIIDHCNLHMSEKRLIRKGQALEEDHAQLPDLIHLVSCLQQIKEHSFMTPKQRRFIEQCEEELKTVVFEPRDLIFITNALQTKLKDDSNTRGVFGDLTSFQNTIEDLSPDIEQCEQLLQASIDNGEMKLAEDISKRQLEIYEHILRLITDQYPIISNYYSESRNSDRRRRWAIFCMADKDINAVIEGKYRQVEACEEDLVKIREQIENYNQDDVQQRRRYEADKTESDEFLKQNKDKQQAVWNRIFAIFQELQGCAGDLAQLGQERRKEINRRLQVEEREAGRRSGHEAFLQAAAAHAQKLQDTIDNALAAKDIAEALNNFVLDGCDSITAKYDKQQNALSDMLRLVQQHHFRRFSDYYISASRYLYRKEHRLEKIEEEMETNNMQREMRCDTLDPAAKQFAEANGTLALRRREVAQEVLYIRHKLEKAEKAIEPTLRSLEFTGIDYVHPRLIVEKMNLERWSTMLDYRSLMDPAIPALERIRAEEQAALDQLRAALEAEAGIAITEDSDGRLHVRSHRNNMNAETRHAMEQQAQSSSLARRAMTLLQKPLSSTQAATANASASEATAQGKRNVTAATTATATTAAATSNGRATGSAPSSQQQPTAAAAQTATTATTTTTTTNSTAAARALPAKMEGAVFRALYRYKARAPDELALEVGDRVVCVNRTPEEGWFKGVCNQRTGLFPINYVEPVEE